MPVATDSSVDPDTRTHFSFSFVARANEAQINKAFRDHKRDVSDLHPTELFSKLPIATQAEESTQEGGFADLFDFGKFNGKPPAKVKLQPYSFYDFPAEIRALIYDHVLKLPKDRDTVFVQPPWKWHRYNNPDFRHALFKVSKLIRKEAICELLLQNNLNIDTVTDIKWLYFWANNGGVRINVEYNIDKLQFLEFDRYNHQKLFSNFLTRVVYEGRLKSLRLRIAGYRVADMTAEEIMDDQGLDKLRAMRGLEHVEVWLWDGGDYHSDPRMQEITNWLREEMCKPGEKKPSGPRAKN
ncbi:hypothetical protein NA57DRAFT_75210 [Rhizodiscina lignyota]|uniref:Uncharacterized protein n=1 Tax=Rhizodiscina lignyota TaxID=1504668 RepID=A0A9P4IK98_9PEZI|nr:hypothetical protein NA57DRAFT_75210 [Rhizodiscina lignyota]